MKEKPILFNTEMVKAVLEGRKTQTRRVIKNACDIIQDWDDKDKSYGPYFEDKYGDHHKTVEVCPYGQIGDKLWVRETFTHYRGFGEDVKPGAPIIYKADKDNCGQYPAIVDGKDCLVSQKMLWNASIFMPKSACRIWMEITDIRVERVRDITPEEITKEGVVSDITNPAMGKRHLNRLKILWTNLWNSINEKRGYSWESNPWVWVVEFKRV